MSTSDGIQFVASKRSCHRLRQILRSCEVFPVRLAGRWTIRGTCSVSDLHTKHRHQLVSYLGDDHRWRQPSFLAIVLCQRDPVPNLQLVLHVWSLPLPTSADNLLLLEHSMHIQKASDANIRFQHVAGHRISTAESGQCHSNEVRNRLTDPESGESSVALSRGYRPVHHGSSAEAQTIPGQLLVHWGYLFEPTAGTRHL